MWQIIKKVWRQVKQEKIESKFREKYITNANKLLEKIYDEDDIACKQTEINDLSSDLYIKRNALHEMEKYIAETNYEKYKEYVDTIRDIEKEIDFLQRQKEYMQQNQGEKNKPILLNEDESK